MFQKGEKTQSAYKSFKYKEFFLTILKIDTNNDSNLKYPVMGIEYTNYNVATCWTVCSHWKIV